MRIAFIVFVLLMAAASLWVASHAQAQPQCGPREMIVDQLQRSYGEVSIGKGMTRSGAIFEIWLSREKGTWTILKTTPQGLACLMVVGDSWQFDEKPEPGDPT